MFRSFYEYWRQIFSTQRLTKKVAEQIYIEMTTHLSRAYSYPQMLQYMRSLPVELLLSKSVECFVGSKSVPRNPNVQKIFMTVAMEKAENDPKLKNLVKYYIASFGIFQSVQQKNQKQHYSAFNLIKTLANNGHSLSNYIIGKELLMQSKRQPSKAPYNLAQIINQAFFNSINDKQYGGLYYIANFHEEQAGESGADDQELQTMLLQLYTQAASQGNALSLFKISSMYKAKKSYNMFKRYLIAAAEMGSSQAQYSLATEYNAGVYFPKDEVKAFAWFLQASKNRHIMAQYQMSKIYAKGTECGRILANKKEALAQLKRIKQSGMLDVDKDIEEINAEMSK